MGFMVSIFNSGKNPLGPYSSIEHAIEEALKQRKLECQTTDRASTMRILQELMLIPGGIIGQSDTDRRIQVFDRDIKITAGVTLDLFEHMKIYPAPPQR